MRLDTDRIRSRLLIALAVSLPFSIAGSSLVFFPLLVGYLLAGAWTLRAYPWQWGPAGWAFLAFVGISLCSALFGVSPFHSHRTLFKDFYFLMVPLVASLVPSTEERWRLVKVFVVASAAAALLGLIQFVLGLNQTDHHSGVFLNVPAILERAPVWLLDQLAMTHERAAGTRSHPITYAEGLVLALAPALALWWGQRWRPRKAAVCVGLLLAGIVVSQSRGPWLASGLVCGAGLWLLPGWGRAWKIGVLAAPLLLVLTVPVLRARLVSIADLTHPSNSERLRMWKAGWALWKDNPWLGVGPGNVRRAVSVYQEDRDKREGPWGHLHNTYVHLLAERGILGLGTFLFWMGTLGWMSCRRWNAGGEAARALGLMGVLALVGFLSFGLTERAYGDAEIVMTFFFLMGLI